MASHEIGHAKHSDFGVSVFKEMVERYGDLFNVVEDARIERLMKMEFQGLASIFKAGYRTLADEGIFPLEGIETAPLVERLNVFAKFGFMKDVPFSREEAAFSYRLLNLSTKTDVVDLCEDILAYIGKEISSKNDFLPSSSSLRQEEGEESEERNGSGSSPDSEDNGEPDGGESEEEDGEADGDSASESDEGLQALRRELTDERMRQMERTIANETRKTNKKKTGSGGKVLVLKSSGVCEASVSKLSLSDLKNWRFPQTAKTRRRELAKIAEKVAQSAASMFTQKQSALANAARRKRTVGRIDTRRLAQYGITDALFRQAEKVAKGKSHGVVLLLDYSISMEDAPGVLLCACMQAAILARFCQMIRIPFSVYLFGCGLRSGWDKWNSHEVLKVASEEWFSIDFLIALAFVKHSSIKTVVKINDGAGIEWSLVPGGSTPLLEAVIAGRRDILKMRASGVEKPAIFIVTDGAYTDVIETGEETSRHAHVLAVRKVILDGKSCGEDDFKEADRKRLNACGGLAFELLARHLKKETGADVVFSSIASRDRLANNLEYWFYAENAFGAIPICNPSERLWMRDYIEPYLYKHCFLFGEPFPQTSRAAFWDGIFTQASVKNDSIIDLFLMMNTSVLQEIESDAGKLEDNDPQAILAWLKASSELLKAYRGLASAFVEFFA